MDDPNRDELKLAALRAGLMDWKTSAWARRAEVCEATLRAFLRGERVSAETRRRILGAVGLEQQAA